MDKLLSLLGLAKKAGRLEAGEEPVGAAARVHDLRLILLASDAAENTERRARRFAGEGDCLWARIPAAKEDLGRAVGVSSCALLGLRDIGFAEAAAKRLAELDPAQYAPLAERLSLKAKRAAERKKQRSGNGRPPNRRNRPSKH